MSVVPYKKRKYVKKAATKPSEVATKTWVKKQLTTVSNEHVYFVRSVTNDWQPTTLQNHVLGGTIGGAVSGVGGVNRGNRIGDEIFYKRLEILLAASSISATLRFYIRTLVVKNYKPLEAQSENMFVSESNVNEPVNWTSTGGMMQLYKPINTQKYEVLHDEIHTLGPDVPEDGYHSRKVFKINVPINKKITYNNESDTSERIHPVYNFLYWVCAHTGQNSFPTPSMAKVTDYREYFNA